MIIKTQIVIWMSYFADISGIVSFIYYFCQTFKDKYDILVLFDRMTYEQQFRLKKIVRVEQDRSDLEISCDTLIVNNLLDHMPCSVKKYDKKIRVIHGCKLYDEWVIPKDDNYDYVIPVSEAVKESFNDEIIQNKCRVINNITYPTETIPALRLISATRLSEEKGGKRIVELAKMMNSANIPFIWTIFTNSKLPENVNGIILMKPQLNISPYIASSDYLIQLSDTEGFGYSLVEALELGVPIITTPVESLNAIGFEDKKHGYVIPFDMNFDVRQIINKPKKFNFKYDNDSRVKQWIEILGDTTPLGDYKFDGDKIVKIRCTDYYYSLVIERDINPGEILTTTLDRAQIVAEAGKCEILE